MPSNTEGRVSLALNAFKSGQITNLKRAAVAFGAPYTTLRRRVNGTLPRHDIRPKTCRLTVREEEVLVKRILDLDSRGFPPKVSHVREMANLLLTARQGAPVGKCWTTNFVSRRKELKSKFSRKYDYKRALCEDPEVIRAWFERVHRTIEQHGILEEDIYNFDETGFQMGVAGTARVITGSERRNKPNLIQPGDRQWTTVIETICARGDALPPFIILSGKRLQASWYTKTGIPSDWTIGASENGWTNDEMTMLWLQSFEKLTRARTVGMKRLLVLDGHGSHITVQFDEFCSQNNIIPICMPAHSSHILQPLDICCFAPLKAAYRSEIDANIRLGIHYITKDEFIVAFKQSRPAAISTNNIKKGFSAAGLVPLDPNRVLEQLNTLLRTPSPLPEQPRVLSPKTPHNAVEFEQRSQLLTERRVNHSNSSPTVVEQLECQFIKGILNLAHEYTLDKARVEAAETAIARLTQRKTKRRKYLHGNGALSVQEAQDQLDQGALELQIANEMAGGVGGPGGSSTRKRAPYRCRLCQSVGHNSRKCPKPQ